MSVIALLVLALVARVNATDVAGLMSADSAFAAASAEHGYDSALSRFLANDVIVPLPGGTFAQGVEAARAALTTGPFADGTVSWRPVRAGISADGTHGFTFGYMTIARDDSTAYAKYMAYWEKRDGVWRVRGYKRAPAQAAAIGDEVLPPSLPAATPAVGDAEHRESDRQSLAAAESAFSDEAQRIGLGAAFAKYGRDDAVNMGPPNSAFIVGAAAIGQAVGGGAPTDSSPVVWAADHEVIVAPSGDLGITFGIIRRNGAEPSAPGFAFFTIWRRDDRAAPWRYIAE